MKKETNNRISSFVVITFVLILISSCSKKNNTTPVVAMTPSVTTSAVSAITTTTATSGGNVTSDGGASVTVRGVCWSTSANPTTSNSKTTNETATGTFTSSLAGLTEATIYYMGAYATNGVGHIKMKEGIHVQLNVDKKTRVNNILKEYKLQGKKILLRHCRN